MRDIILILIGIVLFAPYQAWAQGQKDAVLQKMQQYQDALKTGTRDNILPLLNAASFKMMKTRPYSSAMMQREAKNIQSCGNPHAAIRQDRAVIFYLTQKKHCNPYFLQYEKGGWRFDLYTMSKVIRFDHSNHWIFNKTIKHPYMFVMQ